MVQHLLHIQNLVTPEIWYNIRRFRRLVSPLGASGSGFGIFQPPPDFKVEKEKLGLLSFFFLLLFRRKALTAGFMYVQAYGIILCHGY